jgi:hypothetical protein
VAWVFSERKLPGGIVYSVASPEIEDVARAKSIFLTFNNYVE